MFDKKQYFKNYYQTHKEEYRLRNYSSCWHCSETEKRYRETPERKEYQREYHKKYYKIRYEATKDNPQYKLRKILRNRMKNAVTRGYIGGSAVKDLGCSIIEFKKYLEDKFVAGMTWENWGIYGWHLDHIIPLVNFDLTDRKQFLKACHYTNLQPLWAKDNMAKSRRFMLPFILKKGGRSFDSNRYL